MEVLDGWSSSARDARGDAGRALPAHLSRLGGDVVLCEHVGTLPLRQRRTVPEVLEEVGRHLGEVRFVADTEYVRNRDVQLGATFFDRHARIGPAQRLKL